MLSFFIIPVCNNSRCVAYNIDTVALLNLTCFFFLLSQGHGGKLRDDDRSEEDDGYDEALIPLDYQESGFLRDDELYDTLIVPLKSGVKLTCLMDCCHSGTILDLPFKFLPNGEFGEMEIDENYDFEKLFQKYGQSVSEVFNEDSRSQSNSWKIGESPILNPLILSSVLLQYCETSYRRQHDHCILLSHHNILTELTESTWTKTTYIELMALWHFPTYFLTHLCQLPVEVASGKDIQAD